MVYLLAFRSLTRQRRRSMFALAAIGFGVVAMLLATGFIEWNLRYGRENTIRSQLGHLQITKAGYRDQGAADPFGYILPASSPVLDVLAKTPHVRSVGARLSFTGLLSQGDSTLSFLGEGVDPAAERDLSEALRMNSGENLVPGDQNVAVLGQGLADNLGVHAGDTLTIMATTGSGGINAMDIKVKGTFTSITKAFDDVALRLPIGTARTLLRVRGAHIWVVLLDDTDATDAVLASVSGRLPKDLEGTPWYKLADFYNKTSALFSKQIGVMRLIIAAIIVLSIANTMTMSVLERTSEIGTAMALGIRRRAVLQQFITEGVLLGIAGGLIGLAAALVLAPIISTIGIPMPPAPGTAHGHVAGILVNVPMAANAVMLAFVTALIASLYPAWKASRMEIVDALRHAR